MIEIHNLNKYYNKGKKNELHVLNSISLSINGNGMVALFGKSGSGKTTILNCLGGIDNYDSGQCHINGVKTGCTEHFYSYKRKNIGFVFQNYSLIEDQTVEENLMTALKIAGKSATLDKINAALKVVGMSYYNKRIAGSLSGGQKQLVTVARALCIDPCVILADEPTGNLDHENTIKVLDILKEISQKILVVIVSHEREIVERYADRIIEIDDYHIVSDQTHYPNILHNRTEQTKSIIQKQFTNCGIVLNLFYPNDFNDEISLDVALTDGNVYVCARENNVLCVDNAYEALCSNCETFCNASAVGELENDSKEQIESVECQMFQTDNIGKKKKIKRQNFLKTRLQKITAAVMMLTAVLLALTVSIIDGAMKVNKIEYQSSSENAVALHFEPDSSEIEEVQTDENVLFLAPYTVPITFEYYNKALYQTNVNSDYNVSLKVKPLPLYLLPSDKILYGRMPKEKTDVIIDKFFIDSMFAQDNSTISESSIFGISSTKSFIGGWLTLGELSVNVVGISDTGTPTVYMHEELITSFSFLSENYIDKILLTQDYVNKISTSNAINFNEVLVSKQMYIDNNFDSDENSEIDIGDKIYKVKGWYESNGILPESVYIVSNDALCKMEHDKLSQSTYAEIIVSGNVDETIKKLEQNRIYGESLLKIERDEFRQKKRSEMILQIVLTIITGFSALLCWCFSTKSIVAERKKELSIKVVLGMKRNAIIRQFVLNTFSFSAIFALPFYIATQLAIKFLLSDVTGIFSTLNFSITYFLIGLVILVTMPIVVTLVSLREFIYKKPIDLLKEV